MGNDGDKVVSRRDVSREPVFSVRFIAENPHRSWCSRKSQKVQRFKRLTAFPILLCEPVYNSRLYLEEGAILNTTFGCLPPVTAASSFSDGFPHNIRLNCS